MHARYDADPVGALSVALRRVLDVGAVDWMELIALAGFDAARAGALGRRDLGAMDALLRELNELRQLDPYPPRRWIDAGS